MKPRRCSNCIQFRPASPNCRDSAAFADELVAGLEFGGFAPFLDRHDIAAGEDWKARNERP
jgi:hypothetical protein